MNDAWRRRFVMRIESDVHCRRIERIDSDRTQDQTCRRPNDEGPASLFFRKVHSGDD